MNRNGIIEIILLRPFPNVNVFRLKYAFPGQIALTGEDYDWSSYPLSQWSLKPENACFWLTL